MNSIWNKNILLFQKRFPQLFKMMENQIELYKKSDSFPFEIFPAKNSSPTAAENGKALHSKYNPELEAEQLTATFEKEEKTTAVFLSAGLGYGPIQIAKKNHEATIIVIEKDEMFFLHSLSAIDWEILFTHPKLIFITGDNLSAAKDILKTCSAKDTEVFSTPSLTAHGQKYFDSIKEIIRQNKEKDEINTNTLEKFSSLWLRNSARNLQKIFTLDGVKRYENKGAALPFVILGAGPSLEKILPYLKEIKKRAVLVCVDTALHACLSYGVEPDFILLVDPQYSCALHLEFLSSPSSILITECAAWPSVFRFNCREVLLCASQFPIGAFFEKKCSPKGRLAAGGSVATTAWDFALFCGAKEIFIAGMDLGFPSRQTHIRGSQFEERAHRLSTRLHGAENDNALSLFSAQPCIAKDFLGKDLLSDKRMDFFAWWFSNRCPREEEKGTHTYTLTPESRKIEGMKVYALEDFLLKKECEEEKKLFLSQPQNTENEKLDFKKVLEDFILQIESLESLSKKGKSLCERGIKDAEKIPSIVSELNAIDKAILESDAKEAASLVFPTERQLKELANNLPEDEKRRPIYFSKLIYTELLSAIKKYKDALYHSTCMP